MLETLVARENLNTVILNLYPGNKGYSLAFRQEYLPQNKSFDGLQNIFSGRFVSVIAMTICVFLIFCFILLCSVN